MVGLQSLQGPLRHTLEMLTNPGRTLGKARLGLGLDLPTTEHASLG